MLITIILCVILLHTVPTFIQNILQVHNIAVFYVQDNLLSIIDIFHKY